MEFKAMTRQEFIANVRPRGEGHYGKMQALVKEFYDSGVEYAEVLNPYTTPKKFQSIFTIAAKRMGVNCKATIREGRVFVYRV